MSENNIEVERRSFITKEQYEKLLVMFTLECGPVPADEQVTHYFDAPVDIRIQKNNRYSKIWLKKGAMHSEEREEIEVKLPRDDFEKLEQLFAALGYNVKVTWYRKRHQFGWNGLTVCLDENKGYGHIIEMEKMADENSKADALTQIENAFSKLNIQITPKKTFDERYAYYLQNWKTLTRN